MMQKPATIAGSPPTLQRESRTRNSPMNPTVPGMAIAAMPEKPKKKPNTGLRRASPPMSASLREPAKRSATHEEHENRGKRRSGKREKSGDRETEVAHGAEREELLRIRGAERHQRAVNSGEEAEPHHLIRDIVHREKRNDPVEESEHAGLAHHTRKDCGQGSGSFGVSLRLPSVEGEERSLDPEREGEAPEENVLRVSRKHLNGEHDRERSRGTGLRENVPQGDSHRGGTRESVNREVQRGGLAVRAAIGADEHRGGHHHRFEKEEEQHGVAREEGAVQGAHQSEHADGEVPVMRFEGGTRRDEGGEPDDARKEHEPCSEAVGREHVIDGRVAARDEEPFVRGRRNGTRGDEHHAADREGCREKNGETRSGTVIVMRSGDHQKGREERSENEDMEKHQRDPP